MTATLLLALDIEPGTDLVEISQAIFEDLLAQGHPVLEVKPWAREGQAANFPPISDLASAIQTNIPQT